MKYRKMILSHNIKVSFNDLIVRAVCYALKKVPILNSTVVNEKTQKNDNIDISIAVATDKGLFTPIVKSNITIIYCLDCDKLTLSEISSTIKNLSMKARSNKLLPEEYQGGTFTVSNLGMFGVRDFSAVINPPQVLKNHSTYNVNRLVFSLLALFMKILHMLIKKYI